MQILNKPTNPTRDKPRPVLMLLFSFLAALGMIATTVASTSVAGAAGPDLGGLEEFNDPPISDEDEGGGGSGGGNPPSSKPTAAIALGDSFVSGEGAGGYVDVGGRSQPDDYDDEDDSSFWCHRSAHASIEVAALPGIDARFNLACSGAKPAHIDGESPRIDSDNNKLASQIDQLEDVHATHDIELILIGIGSNQDYAGERDAVETFGGIIGTCAGYFLVSSSTEEVNQACDAAAVPTAEELDNQARLANATAIEAVLDRMEELHYAPGDFRIVVQNFTNPLGENFHPDFHTGVWPTYASDSSPRFWGLYTERYKAGCPVHLASNALGHQFSDNLNQMVEDAARMALKHAQRDGHDVAFLDVADAFDGDRICENPGSADNALAAPLRARFGDGTLMTQIGAYPSFFVKAVLNRCVTKIQLCQESLHPNVVGHAVLSVCLSAAWTSQPNSRIDCRRINGQTQATPQTSNWIAPPAITFDIEDFVQCNGTSCLIIGSYEMTVHKPHLGKGGTITRMATITPAAGGTLLGHNQSADGLSGTYTVSVPCPDPAEDIEIGFEGKSEKTTATGTYTIEDDQTHTVALPC